MATETTTPEQRFWDSLTTDEQDSYRRDARSQRDHDYEDGSTITETAQALAFADSDASRVERARRAIERENRREAIRDRVFNCRGCGTPVSERGGFEVIGVGVFCGAC